MNDHCAYTRNEDLAAHFGVDVKTIRRWARRLNLVKSEEFMRATRGHGNNKYYTKEQEAWRIQRIAEVYPDADGKGMHILAEELGISVSHIRRLAIENGVRRSQAAITKAQKKGHLKMTKFTPKIIAALREYYPDHTNKECAEHFGMNLGSLKQVAIRCGMKKSKEHRSLVNRKNNINFKNNN